MPRLRAVLPIVALGLLVPPASSDPVGAATNGCTVSHVLRWGARRSEVTCLEQALVDNGYPLVGPDTYLGVSTSAAVRRYQGDHGLAPDGIADAATTAALGIGAPDAGPTGDQNRVADAIQHITIGTSVQGRPITATERGTAGGKVVLVFGVIHGDENAGRKAIELLKSQPVPPGIDLWLVDSMNPDGEALNQRQNANGVDMNHALVVLAKSSEPSARRNTCVGKYFCLVFAIVTTPESASSTNQWSGKRCSPIGSCGHGCSVDTYKYPVIASPPDASVS